MRDIERTVLLTTIDELWVDHLTDIERLEEGIGLVGYAQMEPYVVFRKSAGLMFKSLLRNIRRHAVSLWFAVTPMAEPDVVPRPPTHSGHRRRRKR